MRTGMVNYRFGLKGWWLLGSWLWAVVAWADPCVRLVGVVQDYATQRPLQAKLYLKLPTGRVAIGQSAAGTGQFTIEVDCRATVLLVEQIGYQPQQLRLSPQALRQGSRPLGVLIPLVAVDRQTTDQVYQQAAQTHYEQQANQAAGKPQRGLFTITDALTSQPLSATAHLYPTNGQAKRDFVTDDRGQFETTFAEQDIIALEVQAKGYLPYQGNIAVEQLDGQVRRHPIRLVRELALVTVQVPTDWRGVQCSVQPGDAGTSFGDVPGAAGTYCLYTLEPGTYQLLVEDGTGGVRHRQTIRVGRGLNVFSVAQPASSLAQRATSVRQPPTITTASPAPVSVTSGRTVYRLPDEIPMVYFDQGSYQLDDEDRDLLQQVGVFLRSHPEYRLKLIGHTDPEGDEQMNRYLSEFRAKMIANYLFWQGIPDNRMTISGQGSRYPVARSDDETNKAKNRRVFLKLELAHE